jgi:1-acyl-sn-glycerol-3-phosphate acyltransferase
MEGEKQEDTFQPIDIKEVVKARNAKLAARVPAFIYRWLTKILHIDEVNNFLEKHWDYQPVEFINEGIKFLGISYEVIGEENIPVEQRFICVSNHPLGGLDGMLILKLIYEKTGSARNLSNDFLMNVRPLSPWFVPINKIGGQARGSLEAVESLYQSTDNIMIFPAGLCSRKVKGKIVDLQWQKHFIQKAVKHQIDILPVQFIGRNSNRFYNLANIRKFLGIKFNFEMIFLVDEMFSHKGKTFQLHIGKPIPYSTFNNSKRPLEWANFVKEKVYQLNKSN